jgi:hypothetical protein
MGIPIYWYTIYSLMDSTTVKVSKETAKELAALQHTLRAKTLEETIGILMKRHRRELLDEAFGKDRGKLGRFKEEDRGEDRY